MKNIINACRLTVLFFFLVTSSNVIAASRPETGNDFLRACKWTQLNNFGITQPYTLNDIQPLLERGMETAFCTAFIVGFLNGNVAAYAVSDIHAKSQNRKPDKHLWCPPRSDVNQLMRVYVKYLEDHPEKLHMQGGPLLTEALFAAFPCNE